MYRVILVDDEPLILAGITSLLTWEEHDCTIVGKATNGPTAYDLIMELQPDIVITDICMPVLSGLELIEKCKTNGCNFAFLVLTNLEEFQLARKAVTLGASDYLVKLNLKPEDLIKSLDRAKEACDLMDRHNKNQMQVAQNISNADLMQNYVTQLIISQNKDVTLPESLKENYKNPFVILFTIRHTNIQFLTQEERLDLKRINSHITDIISGISARFFHSHTLINYNSNTFLFVGGLRDDGAIQPYETTISYFCDKVNSALKTYFELTAVFGISQTNHSLELLPDIFKEALTALEYYYYNSHTPIVFYQGQNLHKSSAKNFNINFLKKDLSASIQQNDSERLANIFDQIIELFTQCTPNKEHATSACINIYTYLYSFFETDKNDYHDIFPYAINIAEYLNHFPSLANILEWLRSFQEKLCKLLDNRKENRSDILVEQAKRYIEEHYTEKLTLAEITEELNISAGHLSATFKKYTGITLSDYIASVKIERAKELIDTHKYLMYEISDMLGFDNPYYFSKVFKKVTGISPRDHERRM